MNIFEVLNITQDDPIKYRKVVLALGKREVFDCLPFTAKEIEKAIKTDPALNNLPLRQWSYAAGYDTGFDGGKCIPISSSLMKLMKTKLGVTSFTCVQNVCILKEAAFMLTEERRQERNWQKRYGKESD